MALSVALGKAGFEPASVDVTAHVTVEPGATVTADAGLEAVTISLGEIVVEGASRAPERIVEAPAAISVVPPEVLARVSATGQAPPGAPAAPGRAAKVAPGGRTACRSRGNRAGLRRLFRRTRPLHGGWR